MKTRPAWGAAALAALLATGCGEDPLGPDTRLALIAFGQCRYDQAMQLTENAIARGTPQNVSRARLLQAAILRDRGDTAAAEALNPAIDAAWQAARHGALKPERRERDIRLFIEVARAERQAHGLAPDCSPLPAAAVDLKPAATQ